MRERITFIHEAEDAFSPDQLQVRNDTLHINSLGAAREDRLTFSPHELPQELWQVLKQCHELHIRWVSSNPYSSILPFVSRASPGLNLFFTPRQNRSVDQLCPLLQKIFGLHLKCSTPQDTFTGLPMVSERFATSSAFQYHQLLPSLAELKSYVQQKICSASDLSCHAKAVALHSADYLDIDYDAISQSLVLSVFRHASPSSGIWDETLRKVVGSANIEVGILANEKPTEPERLSLGGFLTVIGEDTKPTPTLFSFPSRHHLSPQDSGRTYHTTFTRPTGLHPTLRLTFRSPLMTPPSSTCALHTYLTLPSHIFPDKYQLSDPLFLASKNLRSVRSVAGETDLEAPDWVIQKWGSALLVELAPPSSDIQSTRGSGPPESWHADIPLHLRYLRPSAGGITEVEVPWPVVFWACTAEEGSKMSVNPFDRVNLGYDGLFGPKT
ncbi:MAG: hypothetical protein LQ347_006059, partial [Umbilicaria vellea]